MILKHTLGKESTNSPQIIMRNVTCMCKLNIYCLGGLGVVT